MTPVEPRAERLAPAARPLDLPRLVMRRAAAVVLLGVLGLLLLGLARMRDTVDDELAGARLMARLTLQLSTLRDLPDAQARQALKDWQSQGDDLRHLHLRVSDAQGRTVVDDVTTQHLSAPMRWLAGTGAALFRQAPPFRVDWPLARPDGGPWQVSLTAEPESERVEALTSLVEGVSLFAALGMLMLGVMAWNTRRAFRPLSALLTAIAHLQSASAAGVADGLDLPAMPIAELDTIARALQGLQAALAEADQARRRLAGQMLSLQEDERLRLARELHDEFGQRLTALRVNATYLGKRLEAQAELQAVAQDMAAQCEQVQQDVRSMLGRLRPLTARPGEAGADGHGLPELAGLLRALVADWQRSAGPGTRYALKLQAEDAAGRAQPWPDDMTGPRLARDAVLAVYRISQEALTNVARHAQAAEAVLSLSVRAPTAGGPPTLQLDWSVDDDGQGLAEPAAAFSRGNGLAGIQERLWALGSDLQWRSGPGQGCHLQARLRLPVLAAPALPETAHG